MNILFVCKHNLFRSVVAEAYFNKINRNSEIKATSAGIIPGIGDKRSTNQEKAITERGLKLKSKPSGLSVSLLKKQDLIIVVADDIPLALFNNKNYIRQVTCWGIKDVLDNDWEKSRQTITKIMTKVEELAKQLEVTLCP